jgi:hypothetical protein
VENKLVEIYLLNCHVYDMQRQFHLQPNQQTKFCARKKGLLTRGEQAEVCFLYLPNLFNVFTLNMNEVQFVELVILQPSQIIASKESLNYFIA